MADKDHESSDEEEKTIADDVVVTKYNMAGTMANGKVIMNPFYLPSLAKYLQYLSSGLKVITYEISHSCIQKCCNLFG